MSGTVHAVANGAVLHTFEEGEFLDDLAYFDPTILTFDTYGGQGGGVLGGFTRDAVDELATSRPLLMFTLLRHLGAAAVNVRAPSTPPHDAHASQTPISNAAATGSSMYHARSLHACVRAGCTYWAFAR
jgi:hypothetical protein